MPRESLKERSRKYDSSDGSSSEYSQKSSKRKYRSERSKRSRSREKSSSHRRKRSTSRSKKSSKSKRADSRSPIRYYSSKRRSSSKDRTGRRKPSRSVSKERSYERSKSRSRERSDYSRSRYKKSTYKSSKPGYDSKRKSSSRSVSPYSIKDASNEASKKYVIDDTETKVEKAIKAAEAAGLTMCKLPLYEYKEVEVKEDMPTIQDRNVLDELNSESFAPRQFTSSRNKKLPENIVIDLDAGTVKVPEVQLPKVESLFHPDLFPDEKTRMEKWVKKMFQFRQKALKGEI